MTGSRLDPAVGIVAAAGLDLLWADVADLVDVIEVEPQTMWTPHPTGGWDVAEPAFDWVETRGKPTLVHGVGFPVGGSAAPDPGGVALTADCAARLGASHWSEHLSFNRVRIDDRDIDAGFLLPPAQTIAGIEAAVDHVHAYQQAADLPFLIETGVNYLRPRTDELTDGAFVGAIAEQADCGILLDLHNLLTNQRNGRQPIDAVLAELPLERVLEIHVAGGFEHAGYYLDAHVGSPDPELLTVLARVIPQLPSLRVVTFEAVPEGLIALGTEGLRGVLEALHRICDGTADDECIGARAGSATRLPDSAHSHSSRVEEHPDRTQEWERHLAAYTARVTPTAPGSDPGYALLRLLADQARLGQLALARPVLLSNLINRVGRQDAEAMLHRYFATYPPQRWPTDEGRHFEAWLLTALPT